MTIVLPLLLFPLTIGLGGIVTLVHNQIRRVVVLTAGEVAVEDALDTRSIALLGVDRGTGHVGNHGVAAAPWVGGKAEWVVLGGRLGEPDITTIAIEVTGLESLGDILLDDDGTTSSVDEPRTYTSGNTWSDDGQWREIW